MTKTNTGSSATKRSPWWARLALFIGGGWLLYAWVLLPGYHISQVEPPPNVKDHSPLPPKGFLHRIKTYQRASRSLLIRKMAQARMKRAITKYITPRRIERTFRGSLRKATLAQWRARFLRWDRLLKALEETLPAMKISAYRTYLHLQAGMFDTLLHQARKEPGTPVTTRLQALDHAWLGHAAFWCGEFKVAMRLYQSFLRGFDKHPEWDRRSPSNWRMPSELSTTLYHVGLLQRLARQPRAAMATFARLTKRWRVLRKKPEHSQEIYFARLLTAAAARAAGDIVASRRWLAKAGTFVKDPTLHAWMKAQYALTKGNPTPERKRGIALLTKLAKKVRRYKHFYGDTQALASLHLAAEELAQGQSTAAIKRLRTQFALLLTRKHPSILSALANRNTFPLRFVPAAPAFFQRLAALLRTHIKQHPPKATPPPTQAASKPAASQPTTAPAKRVAPAASRPAGGPAKPTTRPVQRAVMGPQVPPKARQRPAQVTKKHPQPISLRRLLVSIELMEALAYLKRYAWEEGERTLRGILKRRGQTAPHQRTKEALQAHLYLGMLLTEQRRFAQASRHLIWYYRAYPQDLRGRVYLGHALWMQRRFRDARRLLLPLQASKRWKRTVRRLLPTKKDRKRWKKLRDKAGFWWRLLGSRGWLSLRDPHLARRALLWSQFPHLRRNVPAQQLFHALRTSHLYDRFGLLTLMARHRLQALLILERPGQSKKSPAYQTAMKRWQKMRRLYDLDPAILYIMDRALYSHRWGTFALGFF